MIVLDSDVVTLLSYGRNEKLRQRIEATADEEQAVTVVTRMEVLGGRFDSILKAANEAELTTAMGHYRASVALLDTFVELDVNDQAAGHFERLRKQKKLKMRRPDLVIACIVLARGALLVTRNVKDYKNVAGLRVEDWT